MSNLRQLIFLTCTLLCSFSVLTYAQGTLTITPATGTTYTPNSTQEFTFTLTGIGGNFCQGEWSLTATSTSNYGEFMGDALPGTINVDLATGFTTLAFNTPPSGELTITALAVPVSLSEMPCSTYEAGLGASVTLTAAVVDGGETCDDVPFSEDFEGVAAGTGFSGDPPTPTPPVAVGNGTAYLGTANFKSASYFEVRENAGNQRMEASNFQNGEVYWESQIIPISPCCARTISVDIFGVGGQAANYVKVFYTINGGGEILIGEQSGGPAFSETVSLTTCDIAAITSSSDLRIIVRVRPNNKVDEIFGFDNVQVTAGTPVGVPQIQNIDCTPNIPSTTTTLTVSATSECSPEYSLDGGLTWQTSNIFLNVPSGATYTVSVRDQTFINCGRQDNTVTVDAQGNCTYVFPIELLDFYGRAEADAVGLYWSTATEIDNDFMAVERSLNGIDFEEIGRVTGKGTTTERQEYFFADNYPIAGTNYYRLRQVDFDGSTEYHPVISVQFDKPSEFSFKISPNPARETLQVDWTLPGSQDGILRVFDIQGRMMNQRAMGQGSGRYNLPINDLPAGLYLLQLTQKGQTEWLRFVKE